MCQILLYSIGVGTEGGGGGGGLGGHVPPQCLTRQYRLYYSYLQNNYYKKNRHKFWARAPPPPPPPPKKNLFLHLCSYIADTLVGPLSNVTFHPSESMTSKVISLETIWPV